MKTKKQLAAFAAEDKNYAEAAATAEGVVAVVEARSHNFRTAQKPQTK